MFVGFCHILLYDERSLVEQLLDYFYRNIYFLSHPTKWTKPIQTNPTKRIPPTKTHSHPTKNAVREETDPWIEETDGSCSAQSSLNANKPRKVKLYCLSLRSQACPKSLIQNILYSLADQMKAVSNKTFCSSNSTWHFALLLFLKQLVRCLVSDLQGFYISWSSFDGISYFQLFYSKNCSQNEGQTSVSVMQGLNLQ